MIYETKPLRNREKIQKKQSESELFDEHYRMLEFAIDRKNPLAAELEAIDKLLNEMPEILELVHADINRSDGSVRPK